ncbi:hypothetical protein BN946_scf184640.g14 [Trametes cinnabarina]|uniref:Helitron helicase-like domain-containing protein n=1 Tax=Pycnoporus cinnabarinus TaxID=5643 RepID=A0A060SS38_PYCCI|nr:hypothetical protein BN946_scf184640.g14 [Trametes cinnabarina]
MWASAEQSRINWVRNNQAQIRAALYSGLQDMVSQSDAEARTAPDLHSVGQRIILPSSFQGGPRHWYEQCQDALAICREECTIDFFITATCNPAWKEITDELFPGQTTSDRPDLVARIFHLKQKAIFADIIENGVLGAVSAYIYSNEWQKRGLPHFHSLFMMKAPFKLRETAQIDSCIRWTMF